MSNLNDISTGTTIIGKGFELSSSGVIYELLDQKYMPEQKANVFLSSQAIKNGRITDEDIEKASLIYGSYRLRKQYINTYKAKKKADSLIQGKEVDETASIDEDWLPNYA